MGADRPATSARVRVTRYAALTPLAACREGTCSHRTRSWSWSWSRALATLAVTALLVSPSEALLHQHHRRRHTSHAKSAYPLPYFRSAHPSPLILAAALGGGGTAATEAKKGRQTRQTGSSRAATAVRESLELTGFKYYCAVCNVGMGKLKNFEQHVNGKSHEANVKVARHPHQIQPPAYPNQPPAYPPTHEPSHATPPPPPPPTTCRPRR